jgi:hypothetical protein
MSLALGFRPFAWLVPVLACLGACTAILGNDFEIVEQGAGAAASGSGTGAAAAGGAAAGGSGGGPAPSFACDWDLPEHRLVDSIDAATGVFFDVIAVRSGPDQVRGFQFVQGNSGPDHMRIYTLRTTPALGNLTVSAEALFDAERLSPSEVGALVLRDNGSGPEVWLLVIDDSDPDGGDAVEFPLVDAAMMVDHDPLDFAVSAEMVAVAQAGLDEWAIDFVVGYATAGGFRIDAGRFEDTVTEYGLMEADAADDNAVEPHDMIHFDGTTYVYMGDAEVTQYTLVDGVVTGTPRGITADNEIMGDARTQDDVADAFMLVTDGEAIQLLVGSLDARTIAAFTSADLVEAATFPTAADLPIFEGHYAWQDHIMVAIGNDGDNSRDMAYFLVDNAGRERGRDGLDFTAILPQNETRSAVRGAAHALRSDAFDATGASIHVLWEEDHEVDKVATDVVYYDQLRCVPEGR